jgi:hypothetical protein
MGWSEDSLAMAIAQRKQHDSQTTEECTPEATPMAVNSKSTADVIWRLMFFHPETELLIHEIELTEEQASEIWPCVMALPSTRRPDPYGDYRVQGVFIGASAKR